MKMQLHDETTAQIIRWLEDVHNLSQADLALASPIIKYFALTSTGCVGGCVLLSEG